MTELSVEMIKAAARRLGGDVHRTPVMTSSLLDQLTQKCIYFKCEHLQATGSFKARGALNAVRRLLADGEGVSGVITQSSGNHGQALAWAAARHGLPCIVVVPENAPAAKRAAIAAYGADIVTCESTMSARLSTCKRLAAERNFVEIDPHNDVDIMAGQGTIAIELLEQVDDIDAVLVPVGGGGLAAGIATIVAHARPHLPVFCVEPEGKQLEASLRADTRLWEDEGALLSTIADGIRVLRVGDKCFPHLVAHCQHTVLTVNDGEIASAMKLIWSRMKQTVEATSATSLAALIRYNSLLSPYKKVGVILCGGNVDLNHLPFN